MPEIVLPGILRRLASMVYESLLALGLLAAFFLLPQALVSMAWGRAAPGWVHLAHVFIVMGCYCLISWHRGGQTLAMKTWKLKLVAADGSRPSLARLLVRYCLAWPSLGFFGVGLVWSVFDRQRQFLHDRLAGTRIVFQ